VLIVGIGSNMDLRALAAQWKTVIIALLGTLAGVALIMTLGQLFLGRYLAIAGAPVFAGTNAAILILMDVMNNQGLYDLIPFILLILVTQNFVGIPIASFVLRREARNLVDNPEMVDNYANMAEDDQSATHKRWIQIPEVLQSPTGVFVRIALVASLSFFLASLTGGRVHFLVMCLIMGVLFTQIGFLDKQSLPKTQAYGFIVFVTTVVIFSALADTTPQMMLSLIGPLLVTLALGIIGVVAASFLLSKLLRVSPYMGIAMGVACTFGMPTTFLIPREVAKAIGRDEREQEAIENYLTPNMVTAGFVSVTIASVFIAQFAVSLLTG